jgi:acylphosphatase
MGLTGYARNMPDGTVEAEVQGEDDEVDRFARAVSRGPHMAHVTEVLKEVRPVVGEEVEFKV